MPPLGDLCSCMLALAEDEHILTRIFSHRFCTKGELGGHSFGNLLIAALVEMTGDFTHAVKLAGEVLAIRGRILPVTTANARLVATIEDGPLTRREAKISSSCHRIAKVELEPAGVPAFTEALQAIAAADLITLGPSSFYTSLITNMRIAGMLDALACTPATRIYIANLMTEANESIDLTVSEHIERIYENAGRPIFDYALVNTGLVSASLCQRYASEGAKPVTVDIERIEAMGVHCITGNFVAEGDLLCHAAGAVTDALLALPAREIRLGAGSLLTARRLSVSSNVPAASSNV